MNTKSPTAPKVRVKRAIKHFGGYKELAIALGVVDKSVLNMRKRDVYLPAVQAYKIRDIAPELVEKTSKQKSKTAP